MDHSSGLLGGVTDGPFYGTVKSYNPTKGYGFFECEDTFAKYGKDILVPRSSVEPTNLGALQTGSTFTFNVAEGKTGVVAVNLVQTSAGPNAAPPAEEKEGYYIGAIKSFNETKGWGFIASEPTFEIHGKDMMVRGEEHSKAGSPPVGTQVYFKVIDGIKGPLAVNLLAIGWKPSQNRKRPHHMVAPSNSDMTHPMQQNMVMERLAKRARGGRQEQTYQGWVKSFNQLKGWGFIESDEITAEFGKDLMVIRGDLLYGTAEAGQAVSFSVGEGRTGPIATNVQQINHNGMGMGMGPMVPMYRTVPGLGGGQRGSLHGGGQRLQGWVKSFNPVKGWGFISSEQTQVLYGKDIMVRKEDLPGGHAEPNQSVSFVVMEGRTGPIASKVQLFDATGRPGSIPGVMYPPHMQGRESRNTVYKGSIKMFNEVKGYGFISCEQTKILYHKDIMVRKEALPDGSVDVDQVVSFTVAEGRTGPIAANVKFLDADGQSPEVAASAGKEYHGSIKSFNQVKGWGFVQCEDTFALFKKDIMVLKGELPNDGAGAMAGLVVSFEVAEGRTGPIAVNVRADTV